MITDIIDLLDISIAQTDQTLSSIIKPNILCAQFKNDLSVQMVRGFGKQLLATVNMSFATSFSNSC